ncbi:MAG: SusD/RagB family nutrient-binding outer membrane lipoprotein [Bacteroidota bacterium]
MRDIISRKIAVLLVVLFTATNCADDLKELNVDPTSAGAEAFNPNFLLSAAQLRYTGSADFSYETWRAQLIYCSTMIQHFSTTLGYWGGDKYTVNTAYNFAYFERAYDEQVKFVVDAYETSKNKPQYANLHQIIRIWKATVFMRITDLYGDIPYFDAGQGYYKRIFTPKYDTQEAIYTDLIKELKEASAALDPAKDKPTGDMIYGGDVAKWQRFANSMLIRAGSRLVKINPSLAQSTVEAAAAGSMTSIADNAFVIHDPTGGRPTVNRISQVFESNGGERAQVKWSKTFIDFLKNNNDPRLAVVADIPPVGGNGNPDYAYGTLGDSDPAKAIGMPNGYNLAAPVPITGEPNFPGAVGTDNLGKYSRPRAYLLKLNSPTYVLTYGESQLLLAEAKKRGWNVPGTAAEHYNAGVRAAMETLKQYDAAATISSAAIDAYLAAHPYDDANGLEQINTQYWAATILNDYEAFANWRRTGFPVLVPVNHPNGNTGGVIPRRMLYPISEAANNKTNYEEAVARMGGSDLMTGRVWWDKP